jgi:hypothetical protein
VSCTSTSDCLVQLSQVRSRAQGSSVPVYSPNFLSHYFLTGNCEMYEAQLVLLLVWSHLPKVVNFRFLSRIVFLSHEMLPLLLPAPQPLATCRLPTIGASHHSRVAAATALNGFLCVASAAVFSAQSAKRRPGTGYPQSSVAATISRTFNDNVPTTRSLVLSAPREKPSALCWVLLARISTCLLHVLLALAVMWLSLPSILRSICAFWQVVRILS